MTDISNYAIIDINTLVVLNMMVWDGESDWSAPNDVIAIKTDIAQIGWSYIDGQFTPPPVVPPTPAEILASQSAKLVGLKQLAEAQKTALTSRIGTLNDAIELEMATAAEVAELPVRTVQLKAWKTYAVLLGRVTTQAGWPPEVEWPVQPAEGMDLTVSATTPDVV